MPELALSDLKPPKFRLRESVGDIESLKASIKSIGLLEPILVRKAGPKYEVIAGHRRYVASHEVGLKQVPVNIIEVDDKNAFLIALQENIQRKDMDIIEQAKAFNDFCNKYGWGSMSDLSREVNLSLGYISQRVKLLSLPDKVLDSVGERKLSPSHAEELSQITDSETATKLAEIAIDKGLTTTQLKNAITWNKQGYSPDQAARQVISFPDLTPPKTSKKFDIVKAAREQIVSAISQCLNIVDEAIEDIPEGSERAIWTTKIRYQIHQTKDLAMRTSKELSKE